MSDHFDGERFATPVEAPGASVSPPALGSVLSWSLTRHPEPWSAYRDEAPGPRPVREVPTGAMRVTFINHATTLIQLDGVNVLTDPIWSERCSPVAFTGPRRVRPPGIRFEDLPRIDVVVLSHNHYDHLDLPTLQRLANRWPNAQFFAGLGNAALLRANGLTTVTELDWWQSRDLRGIQIHSVPNQHYSNRGSSDSNGSLWSAWVIKSAAGYAYFGGDTGYGPHFTHVYERFGAPRVAVLPIGAYLPEALMRPIHMSPRDAVQAATDLHAPLSVPMHFGTFALADDGEFEAPTEVQRVSKETGVPFKVLGFGESVDVP